MDSDDDGMMDMMGEDEGAVETVLIAASCNRTHNVLELTSDIIFYGSHHSLVVVDLRETKVMRTYAVHTGRVNCVRFIRDTENEWLVSGGGDGRVIIWHSKNEIHRDFNLEPRLNHDASSQGSVTVCDGIQIEAEKYGLLGFITTKSKVIIAKIYLQDLKYRSSDLDGDELTYLQRLDMGQALPLDLVFHNLDQVSNVVMALGMDSGSLDLYGRTKNRHQDDEPYFRVLCTSLKKHEDWVKSIAFHSLGNGETLLATGGQDSFIAIWRFTPEDSKGSKDGDFEFQIQIFNGYRVTLDAMISGHQGWINSLQWNSAGELLSCSSDQSTIVWESHGDIWTEKCRLGTIGGDIPGGFGAKMVYKYIVSWGFNGSIQIWEKDYDEWVIQPSVTGHFGAVSDLDYHHSGSFIVTTSVDQTTRIFSPWGTYRWHEVARPQVHGHDIFAVRCSGDFIVSGAEEKILRAFQPTEITLRNLEEVTGQKFTFSNVAPSATLPALGLSNQTDLTSSDKSLNNESAPLETRLDETFLGSQTLWPEVSKLYGHVYEIACIAASKTDPLIASASNSSKPQFSGIILWNTTEWKKLGEFQFHKLNVADMEFSSDGTRLLSVSRDRSWALWNVFKEPTNGMFSMEVVQSINDFHTRALLVGTWAPNSKYFATGGRDKKIAIWGKENPPSSDLGFVNDSFFLKIKFYEGDGQTFYLQVSSKYEHHVTASAINEDDIVAVGFENGVLHIYKFMEDGPKNELRFLYTLDSSSAHHGIIKRLRFNPKKKDEFASCGSDCLVKVFRLNNS